MTDCTRKGNFPVKEIHDCFVLGCLGKVHPAISPTCPKCNWKYCDIGHCACGFSEETKYAIDIVYKTFCEFCKES